MLLTSSVRKLALITHITSSIGWLGAVATFLALAITGLSSSQSDLVGAAYIAMHLTTWYVIVPFCFASLLTGLIEGFGTPWGLFRHYWIVTKLFLTVLATALLLLHTRPVDRVATLALQSALGSADLLTLRIQLVGDASAALFVLFVTTTLSVYKPWGMTPYGIRRQIEERGGTSRNLDRESRSTGQYVVIAILIFVATVVLLHLFGMGLHAHQGR